jgi:hypothetical protein
MNGGLRAGSRGPWQEQSEFGYNADKGGFGMRRSLLLPALLLGCLNLTAQAEARDQFGSFGHPRSGGQSFAVHRSFAPAPRAAWSGNGQSWQWSGRSSGQWSGRSSGQWSGRSSGMRSYAPPPQNRHFAWGQPGPWFGPQQHVQRFIGPHPVPPLRWRPGPRVARPVIVVRRPYSPAFIRVPPRPGFAFRHDGFAAPHARSGVTIILRGR